MYSNVFYEASFGQVFGQDACVEQLLGNPPEFNCIRNFADFSEFEVDVDCTQSVAFFI